MRKWFSVLSVAAVFAAAPALFAQGNGNSNGQSKDELPIQIPAGTRLTVKHTHGHVGDELETAANDSKTGNQAKGRPGGGGGGGGTPLQTWSTSVIAGIDGKTYTYTMVGANPATSNTSTPITTYLIPLRLNFRYSATTTYSFDPTATDPGCLGGTNTANGLTQFSPIFVPTDYNLGGTQVGSAQYVDAFQRANFWDEVSVNTNYGTELALIPKSVQTVTITSGNSGFVNGTVYILGGTQCGTNTGNTNHAAYIGVANINTIDSAARSIITQLGIPKSAFPIFLLYNAVMSEGSPTNLNNCCVLGYHNASSGQTYGVAEFEGRDDTAFSGVADITALSHEVAEWMDDPMGTNPTPAWGNIGQVLGCQSNLEDGDPLSGTQFPSINMNGFTYHPQELAFASWFYRTAPSANLANGSWFSNNGTFTNDAGAVCH